ncbi:MarR family winged helix-turn-helix transcriptional regulator [Zafaria sp. Z1313]|uniref:MarR family winged helix-turn-helix transcriptional regulator n=1 Tax=Zafaria sp. Z1313 TaxID=3423202 RepID=UPI003D301F77
MEATGSLRLMLALQEFAQASERYVETVGARHHSHRTDMNALAAILRFERTGRAPTPGDLARELRLSAPATTALVDRLVSSGHVERLRAEDDRRRVLLRLTDQARRDGREMFGPLGTALAGVIGHYDPEEIDLLARFVTEAREGVDAASAAVESGERDRP